MRWILILVLTFFAMEMAHSDEGSRDLPKPFRTVFGLDAGGLSFEDVVKKLGKAPWFEAEAELHRAVYAKSMCYQTADGAKLVVTTDFPDKGTPVNLMELLTPGHAYPRMGQCLPYAKEKSVQMSGGLKPGLTLLQIKKMLGS